MVILKYSINGANGIRSNKLKQSIKVAIVVYKETID